MTRTDIKPIDGTITANGGNGSDGYSGKGTILGGGGGGGASGGDGGNGGVTGNSSKPGGAGYIIQTVAAVPENIFVK
ncbi:MULTISPECIES: hypothetical protein [unclassified Paenibacillus]|uniref:hypothetical protein n=1 Tax=unclassified Paenibacillus TaxID=185978 RepID=UPI00362803C6